MRRLLVVVLTALTVSACTLMPHPPGPPAPVPTAQVAASFGKTWDATVDVFTQNNVPIRNLERASGLIVAEVATVGSKGTAYADCGTDGMMARRPDRAFYNVVVRGDSNSSSVRVSARFMNALGDCSTKGVFETDVENAIKARAEGKPLPPTSLEGADECSKRTVATPSGRDWIVTLYQTQVGDNACAQRRTCTYKDGRLTMHEADAIAKCKEEDADRGRSTPP